MYNQIKTGKNILLFLFLLAGVSFGLSAQTFEEARSLAFNGERVKARKMCREMLSLGFNSDIALLMGRTYAWDGKYDSARVVFNDVLIQKPDNIEAYDALSDVEYWSENYDKAIEYCNEAIQKDSSEHSFVLKKAKILFSDEKYEEAVNVLEAFLEKNPGHSDFMLKLKEYRFELLKNYFRLTYTVDFFNKDFDRDPWQITALSYGRKTKLGTVIARVNMAKRFGEQGFQFEMDAYPKLGENNYGYINYGFSQNTLFPKNRFGAELYHNFPKAFEGSLGIRYLDFSQSGVDIYTATFGKYIGNYWLSLRSFVTPDKDGTSVSGFLLVRRYFSDPEDYLGLRLGYGVSPDDNGNLIDSGQQQRLNLKTRSIRFEFNHIFNRLWVFNTAFVLGGEQRSAGTYSGYYTFDLGISRLF